MRFAKIINCDVLNGPGFRVSLFVQGCSIHCKNCFNKELWDFHNGTEFCYETIEKILHLCEPFYIQGLSILGGEPLENCNLHELKMLLQAFKTRYPNKNIWLWTGHYINEITPEQKEIVKLCNVVVEGPYVEQLKCDTYSLMGSLNQEITEICNQ